MIEEYRRSLKMPAAEEIFDLVFYRPLAFIFVKGIYRLPVTPNQITMLSLFSGIVAAWYFSLGTGVALFWGALWYALANILDCADGQLARLQKSGTPLGRLVDGIADYVSSVAIFLGIGVGMTAQSESQWILVVAAGISSAIHAIVFDHYQNEYIAIVRGEKNFTQYEVDKILSQLRELESTGGHAIRAFTLRLYLRYLAIQQNVDTTTSDRHIDSETYRIHNVVMIRFWSLLGPTTNRTLLIVLAIMGRIDFYLWGVLIVGNLWLLLCYVLQRGIHQRMKAIESSSVVPRNAEG